MKVPRRIDIHTYDAKLVYRCPHCGRGYRSPSLGWVGRNKLKFEVRDADLWFLYISTRCRSNHCTKPFLQPLLRR